MDLATGSVDRVAEAVRQEAPRRPSISRTLRIPASGAQEKRLSGGMEGKCFLLHWFYSMSRAFTVVNLAHGPEYDTYDPDGWTCRMERTV